MKKKIFLFLLCGILLLVICGCGKKEEIETIQTNGRDEIVEQIEIVTEYINIREKRDISSNILGKVYKGEIYNIISEDKESIYHWFEIKTTNGIKGFISGKAGYVRVLEMTNINEASEEITEEEVKEENQVNNNLGNNVGSITNDSSINNDTNISNSPLIDDNTNNNSDNNPINNPSAIDSSNDDSTSVKKVISATKEAYCSEGTMQYKNGSPSYCIKEYWEDSYVVVGCPDGYTLNVSEDKCEKGEDRPSLKPANSPYCSDGSQVVYESVSGTFSCRTGTLITQRCPDGYKWVSDRINGINIDLCMWKDYYKTTNIITSCTKGKYYSSRNSCLVTDIISLSYKYVCQIGYTLKDDKCYEN